MGLKEVVSLYCDYFKDGKRCPKVVLLEQGVKEAESTVSSRDSMGKELFFCSPEHMVLQWVEIIRNAGEAKKQPAEPEDLTLMEL